MTRKAMCRKDIGSRDVHPPAGTSTALFTSHFQRPAPGGEGADMRVGIATDHGGFGLKEELITHLRAAGHEIVDFGAHVLNAQDDYPDFVVPLARAVVAREVERGVAICGSGVGASVCANKVAGIRAALIHDHFSAKQGVEDDHLNILCMGGRTVGPAVAWDLVQAFLAAEFSQADRHLRRLAKVARMEAPFDPSTSSGSSRALSRGDEAQGGPEAVKGPAVDRSGAV
jgi:ribose 5-phosphate isomerase B